MPSELSAIFLGLWLFATAIFLYAAYWAFNIRRVLMTSLYRRQAQWIGWMGVYFVALGAFLSIALTLQLNGLAANILGGLIISFGYILIFLWIDSAVRIARRSDPLYRNTFRWSTLRYLFWLITMGGSLGAFASSLISGFASATPYGVVLLFGAIALYKSARRSGDPTLRRHLTWTAVCILLLWLATQAQSALSHFITDPFVVQSIVYPLVTAGAYSLYRSAKSLIPLGRLSSANADDSLVPSSPGLSAPS